MHYGENRGEIHTKYVKKQGEICESRREIIIFGNQRGNVLKQAK